MIPLSVVAMAPSLFLSLHHSLRVRPKSDSLRRKRQNCQPRPNCKSWNRKTFRLPSWQVSVESSLRFLTIPISFWSHWLDLLHKNWNSLREENFRRFRFFDANREIRRTWRWSPTFQNRILVTTRTRVSWSKWHWNGWVRLSWNWAGSRRHRFCRIRNRRRSKNPDRRFLRATNRKSAAKWMRRFETSLPSTSIANSSISTLCRFHVHRVFFRNICNWRRKTRMTFYEK